MGLCFLCPFVRAEDVALWDLYRVTLNFRVSKCTKTKFVQVNNIVKSFWLVLSQHSLMEVHDIATTCNLLICVHELCCVTRYDFQSKIFENAVSFLCINMYQYNLMGTRKYFTRWLIPVNSYELICMFCCSCDDRLRGGL